MKVYLAIILVFGVILGASGAAFGLAEHDGGRHQHGCVLAAASGQDCPGKSDQSGFLNFHFDLLKNYSLGLINAALVMVLALLAISWTWLRPLAAVTITLRSFRASGRIRRKKIDSWIALHEMRDSHR